MFSKMSIKDLGPTKPLVQRVEHSRSAGVMRPRREADHSSPSGVEVKNDWCYLLPTYAFMGSKRSNMPLYLQNVSGIFRIPIFHTEGTLR
jgi:hypothetical protein